MVISNVPDQMNALEVINPDEAAIFTHHCIVSFDVTIAVKVPSKNQCIVYDYIRGDFEGPRASLRTANLANFVSNDNVDINIDWHNWKDALLGAVKDHIPKKKLKGRNPGPWIYKWARPIMNLIKKKESTSKKLKQSLSSYLRSKFRDLHFAVKRRIRKAHDSFFFRNGIRPQI